MTGLSADLLHTAADDQALKVKRPLFVTTSPIP